MLGILIKPRFLIFSSFLGFGSYYTYNLYQNNKISIDSTNLPHHKDAFDLPKVIILYYLTLHNFIFTLKNIIFPSDKVLIY